MAVFAVTDTAFTDTTLPLLTRDPAIDAGTLFCYDVLDTYTWPSQGAASVSDPLIDLAETSNATVSTAGLTWASGFVFGAASTARIQLPTSSDLASDVAAFGITAWVEFASLTGTTDSILTHGQSGSGFVNTQYMVYSDLTALKWQICGTLARTAPVTLVTGTPYQIGITITKVSSNYVGALWVNGVQVDTYTVAGPMVDALAQTGARIGAGDIFGAPSDGLIFYRANANDLTGYSASTFIAADYAVGATRF